MFSGTYQASSFSLSSERIMKCNHLSLTLKEMSQESQFFTLTQHVGPEVFTEGEQNSTIVLIMPTKTFVSYCIG